MPYETNSANGFRSTGFRSGVNILASEHVQFTEEGGTINAAAVGDRYVAVGEPFVRNAGGGGLYEPFDEGAHVVDGALADGFDDPVITNVDFRSNGTDNIVVGELIVRGSVYAPKLPGTVTDAFRALTPNIRYVTRG